MGSRSSSGGCVCSPHPAEGEYEDGKDASTNVVDRIEKCIDHAGPIFDDLVPDTKTFAKLLEKGRVAVAHHLDGVEGSTQQLFLGRAAAWLLLLCLLRDAAAPDTVLAKIAERQDWRWLKGHVKQVLDGGAQLSSTSVARPRPDKRLVPRAARDAHG